MRSYQAILAFVVLISGTQLFAAGESDWTDRFSGFIGTVNEMTATNMSTWEADARSSDPETRARAQRQIDSCENMSNQLLSAFVGTVSSSLGAAEEQRKSEMRKSEQAARAEAYGHQIRKTISDPQILSRLGIAVVGIVGGYFFLQESSKLVAKLIEAQMNQPRLVQETSVVSPLSQLLGTKAKSRLTAKDIVISPNQKKEFLDIVKATEFSMSHNTGFSHLLFHGPPGTGKTLSAKIISQISGLDYAIVAGSSFNQFEDGKDIQELDKIIRWGNNSRKGLILFIDEADSALGLRTGANRRADNLVNYFLSNFERTSHEKIMLVFATNHIEKIDPAVLSRVSKTVYVGLPERAERMKQLELALEKIFTPAAKKSRLLSLFNFNTRKIGFPVQAARELKDHIGLIAELTEGFTGRDIFDLVEQFKRTAILKGSDICSLEMAMTELKKSREKIEARQKIEKIQRSQGHAYFDPGL